MSASEANPTKDLPSYIQGRTEESFLQLKRGMLLAQLGLELRQNGFNVKSQTGLKLAEFIETNMKGKVKVLTLPTNALIKIVVPAEVQASAGEIEALFPVGGEGKIPENMHGLSRALYLAFSKPIPPGMTRRIGLNPHPHFEDVPEGDEKKVGRIDLDARLVVNNEAENDPKQREDRIAQNVKLWLKQNTLDARDVAGLQPSGGSKHSITLQGTLLTALADALGDEDLRRIQLPLDIVMKLLQHK